MNSTGRSLGKNGDVVVEVVSDRAKIHSVTVTEQHETPGVGTVAVDWMPGRIVEANSVDVDAVTGATVTSDAIKAAVLKALKAAPYDRVAEGPAPAAAPAESVEAAAPAGSANLQSTVNGKNGPIVVGVVVEDGVITEVEVLQHQETPGVGSVAVDWMPGRIIEANSVEVDAVTGATVTSDAIKEAVLRTLDLAASGAPAA